MSLGETIDRVIKINFLHDWQGVIGATEPIHRLWTSGRTKYRSCSIQVGAKISNPAVSSHFSFGGSLMIHCQQPAPGGMANEVGSFI